VNARRSALALASFVLLAGCSAPAGTSGTAANGSAGAAQPAIEGSAAAAQSGSSALTGAPPSPATSLHQAGAAEIAWDPALLDVLPPAVAGLDRTAQPDAFSDVKADPALEKDVAAMAIAAYSGGDDLASVSVARLKPGAFGDDFFRVWRDTYDTAACARVGGVNGHAEATIGGHDTFITSCRRLILAYHFHLTGPDRVVSLFAVGPRRLGEELLAHIRD